MKRIATIAMAGVLSMYADAGSRIVEDFNNHWFFHLGDEPKAEAPDFDDAGWQAATLPHDWSVALPFTTEEAGGCTAFLPGGIGWYRKSFAVPESFKGKVVRIDFDGVYNNADVWINGHHLGQRPYGYAPFSYNLSNCLNFGGDNVIAVRADRSAYMDCRWYPGSGIYRDVKLVVHDPVHVQQYGLFVTTEDNKRVVVRTTVLNGSGQPQNLVLKTDIQEADGKSVGFDTLEIKLDAGETKQVEQGFELAEPKLWNTESPYLYTAQVELEHDGKEIDSSSTSFGIRDIRYDPEKGFFLNGKSTLFKGVCLHHDGGCVGAAVPDGVWERRLRILKESGCNAIRTAHNPPSEAFLDLCDRMGFLVQDEAFDEWFNPKDKKYNFNQQVADERTLGYSEHFGEWAERDIKAMVLRDRNHPSIVMWSIGNEIEWTYPGYGYATGYWDGPRKAEYYWDEPPYSLDELKERYEEKKHEQGAHVLAEQASDLARWVKEVDTSRPVTANLVMPSIGHFSGYADALDIVGYSYRTVNYDWGHRHFPGKMIMGTENWVQWDEWKAVLEKPFIPGIFLWTGVDYMGESTEWPQRSSSCGMIDTAGFPKANYWFFKSFWNDEPMVRIATQPLEGSNYLLKDGVVIENPEKPRERTWGWPDVVEHWNHTEGQTVYIELYSNCEETELFLNGRSLGTRRLADCGDRLMKWAVPFEPGELKAIGRNGGKTAAEQVMKTAGSATTVRLDVDKHTLNSDGRDVVHCVAQLLDADGNPVRHMEQEVRYAVEGNASNIGVDNGWSKSTQSFQSDTCLTKNGRCLMVLQAGVEPDEVVVSVSSEGLEGDRAVLTQN